MLALFYLISILLGGISLASWLRLRLNPEGRIAAGIVLGQAGGVWVLYLVSTLTGSLSFFAIIMTAMVFLVLFVASLLLPLLSRKNVPERTGGTPVLPGIKLNNYPVEFLVLAAILTIFFTWLNLHAILPADSMGNLYATEHVWADTPFHISIINSFVERDNFAPTYPILADAPLRYPFLVDLHTAALVKGGMTLRQGIIVSNILLQIPIFLLIYLITQKLGGSRRTGLLASLIFLFLGNFGFLLAIKDIASSGGFIPWLTHLPWGYTGSSLGVESRENAGVGLYLGNPTYLFFMPRRAVTFGMAVSLTLMLVLLKPAQNRQEGNLQGGPEIHTYNKEKKKVSSTDGYLLFIAAGLLLGLLPRIHSHSFIVMVVFTSFMLLSWRWRHANEQQTANSRQQTVNGRQQTVNGRQQTADSKQQTSWRDFYVKAAVLVAVAMIVAIPQLLTVKEQVSNNFFKLWPGWIGEAHTALAGLESLNFNSEWLATLTNAAWVFAKFWIWNAGLLLLLLPFALWKATRNQWIFHCPFILVFILGNVVKIQPWEWDNNNLFVYWQLGTVIMVTLWLGRFLPHEETATQRALREAPLQTHTLKALKYGLLYFFVATLIIGGVLNMIRTSQERLQLWGAAEVKMAKWVRENTAPGSLFLTGTAHNHPIPSLGGRQIAMGFEGWLFAHGISYGGVLQDEIKMFQGDMPLLVKYGIEYVALTPYERGFAEARGFKLNESFLRNPELFELVYRESSGQGTWDIYRVRKPE